MVQSKTKHLIGNDWNVGSKTQLARKAFYWATYFPFILFFSWAKQQTAETGTFWAE